MPENELDSKKDKELVLRDLEHLLRVGHGELVVKVADHKVVDVKYDVHRIISKEDRSKNHMNLI